MEYGFQSRSVQPKTKGRKKKHGSRHTSEKKYGVLSRSAVKRTKPSLLFVKNRWQAIFLEILYKNTFLMPRFAKTKNHHDGYSRRDIAYYSFGHNRRDRFSFVKNGPRGREIVPSSGATIFWRSPLLQRNIYRGVLRLSRFTQKIPRLLTWGAPHLARKLTSAKIKSHLGRNIPWSKYIQLRRFLLQDWHSDDFG